MRSMRFLGIFIYFVFLFFAIFLLFFFTVRLALNRQEIWQQRFEICQNNTKIKFCYVLIFDIRYLTFDI